MSFQRLIHTVLKIDYDNMRSMRNCSIDGGPERPSDLSLTGPPGFMNVSKNMETTFF